MKDISDKIETARVATAEVTVEASPKTIEAARKGDTPKGEVFPVARVAGIMAAKRTSEIIPFCHPVAIDHAEVVFDVEDSAIKVLFTARSIAKTGVEMEALVGAAVAAITIYDMLKPIDSNITISKARVVEKRGGKSNFCDKCACSAAVLVVSDTVAEGKKEDKSGKVIAERLKGSGVDVAALTVVPDDKDKIRSVVNKWVDEKIGLIITTGGTGVGPRDVTVEALRGIIEKEVPGISEAARAYGMKRTPYAMLSRAVAGITGSTIIVALPGSERAVSECLNAIFPYILHARAMMRGEGHS